MRIHHRQIEAFRFVFQTGSATKAGELMGITQPAISRLIRDLEAEVGFDLFDRNRGHMAPTSNAHELHREVERSFLGLDRIARTATDLKHRRAGDLRIAATVASCLYLLPPAIERFRQEWPDVHISMQACSSPEVLDLVGRQQVDLGIATVEKDAAGISQVAFPNLEAVCIMPMQHRLAAQKIVKPHDLASETFLAISDFSITQNQVTQSLEAAGVSPQVILEASFSAPVCDLVNRGIGVAVVEPLTALAYRGSNIAIRRYVPRISIELSAIHATARPMPERASALIAEIHVEISTLCERRRHSVLKPGSKATRASTVL